MPLELPHRIIDMKETHGYHLFSLQHRGSETYARSHSSEGRVGLETKVLMTVLMFDTKN